MILFPNCVTRGAARLRGVSTDYLKIKVEEDVDCGENIDQFVAAAHFCVNFFVKDNAHFTKSNVQACGTVRAPRDASSIKLFAPSPRSDSSSGNERSSLHFISNQLSHD